MEKNYIDYYAVFLNFSEAKEKEEKDEKGNTIYYIYGKVKVPYVDNEGNNFNKLQVSVMNELLMGILIYYVILYIYSNIYNLKYN